MKNEQRTANSCHSLKRQIVNFHAKPPQSVSDKITFSRNQHAGKPQRNWRDKFALQILPPVNGECYILI